MAKQLYVDLNVRANTQQAKAEFQSLQKSLSDVALQTTKMKDISVKSESLNKASAAAKELQRHLSNAVNVDTGKLNLNKLNASLKASKANIGDLSSSLLKAGGSGQEAFMKLAQSVANADRPLITMGSHLNNFLNTLKNTARWQISSTILHGFMGSLQSAYGYAKDLNQSLNNIRIVTGKGVDEMSQFAVEANNAAKALSTSTTAYTDAALIYYQQGLDDKKVKERTDATTKLANVSRQSAEEVSSQMTAIWNNFEQEGKAVEYYADVITALGATTASSSSEIAEGLSKFAAVSDTVGLSYEKASAALATVVAETRQSADVVGTAFKTMFARIEGLKQGETLEDGVGLNKYSEALNKVGVNVLDSNKQLKDMDEILDELGKKWSSIDKSQQVALAQTVAGVRQYTQFISLMDNYDKVLKNQETAETSEGTLQKQADIYAESWEASRKRVQASLQSIYQDLIDDKFFIAMNDGFAKLLNGLNNFIKGIGGLKGVLFGLSSLFLSYISDKIMPAVQNLKISLITMFQSPEKQAKTYGKIMADIMNAAKQNLGLNGTDKMTDSMKVQLNYIDKLSTAKNKLMAMDKKLSDAEKQQAEQELNLISLYQEEVQTLADKLTKEKENVNTLMDSMKATEIQKDIKASRQFDADANSGQTQEWKAIRNSYFDKNGEVADADMADFLEASQQYQNAAQAERDYNAQTEMLIDTSENLTNEMRRGYEELVQYTTGFKEGKDVTVDLGQYLGETGKQFEALGEKTTSSAEKITLLDSCLEDLRALKLDNFEEVANDMEEAKQASKELQQAILDNKNVEQATNTFNEKVNNLKSTLVGGKKVINGVEKEVDGLTISFEKGTDGAKKFVEAYKKMDNPGNVDKINKAYENVQKSQREVQMAQEKLNAAFNNFNPQHVMSGVEVFSKVASAGMQAAMVINSIKTIIEAWNNEDMDPMEKFTTTLMSVGMIIPGVISGIQGMGAVVNGIITATQTLNAVSAVSNALKLQGIALTSETTAGDIAAAAAKGGLITAETGLELTKKRVLLQQALEQAMSIKGQALNKKEIAAIIAKIAGLNTESIALGSEAAATEVSTVAQYGLNTAMEANPIGAIIAAIVALIAVIALVVVAIVAWIGAENEQQKAVREATEAVNEAKEAAESAKQAYEDLKNAVSNYDSAIKALKECTKGTQEWRDAFQEVLAQANAIIEKYPALLKEKNLFNSDGTLNQDVLDKAVKKAEQTSIAANNVYLERQSELAAANLELTKTSTMKSMAVTAGNRAGNADSGAYSAKQAASDAAKDIASTIALSIGAGPIGATAGTLSTIGNVTSGENGKVSMNSLTQDAITALGEKIQKEDAVGETEKIKTLVTEWLKANSDTYHFDDSNDFTNAVNTITQSIVSVSNNFNSLANETENTIQKINNASKMLMKNLFGDEVNSENEIDYVNATAEKRKEISADYEGIETYMDTMGAKGKNDDPDEMELYGADDKTHGNGAGLAKLLRTYAEMHADIYPGGVKEDAAFAKGDDKKWHGQFVDGEGKTVKGPTIEHIKKEVVNARLADSKDEIAQKAKAAGEKNAENGAMKAYAADLDFSNATIEDMEKLQKDPDKQLKVMGLDSDEKIKQFLADKNFGGDLDKVEDYMVEDFKKNINVKLKDALDQFAKIPTAVREAFGDDVLKQMTTDEAKKVSDMYMKAVSSSGEQGKAILKNVANAAGSEGDEVLSALSTLDFDAMDVNAANKELEKLGIQFRLSAEQFYTLKNVLKDTSSVTLETAQETYNTVSSIMSKIKTTGDSIDDESYNKLLAVNPAISECFTTLADGTHMFTGEVQDFKKAMQSAVMGQFYQAKENEEQLAAAYTKLSNNKSIQSSADLEKNKNDNDFYKNNKQQMYDQLAVLRAEGQTEAVQKLTTALDNAKDNQKELNQVVIDTAKAYEDAGLDIETYAVKAEEASKKVAELERAMKETTYKNEVENANLNYEETEEYADVLMELYEEQGLTKDAARELAIANQRVDRGLLSLNENIEKWNTSLKNTNKASAEYAETIGDLRKAFADLLNIADGGELSLEWIEKWANSADMTAILDGDTEALQRFREAAFTEMTTNIFTDMKDSLSEMLDELDFAANKDYAADMQRIFEVLDAGTFSAENLRNAITELNGTEIGSGAVLSQEYVDSLNTMLAQGLLTEQQLNDIFASIGYKPKVTVASVDQWVEVPIYKTTEVPVAQGVAADTKGIGGIDTSNLKQTVTWTEQIGSKRMKQSVPVTQIVSDKKEGGNIEIVNAGSQNITPSYSSTTSGSQNKDTSSSSKSDSSKSEPPKTSAASQKHEIYRYSNEENAIKGLSQQYERLNKLKDQAFGASRIFIMEQELKKLKQLKQASENYLDAIAGKGNASKVAKAVWSGENVGAMISNGKLGGTINADYRQLSQGKPVDYTITDSNGDQRLGSTRASLENLNRLTGLHLTYKLDSFGNVTNEDEIRKALQDAENAENKKYSKYRDPDEPTQTLHEQVLAVIQGVGEGLDQYKETMDKLTEEVDKYMDYIAQMQEKNAEIISSKLERGVNLGERTIQKLERSLKLLGDSIYKSGEAMRKWYVDDFQEMMNAEVNNVNEAKKAVADAERRLALYEKDPFDENAITPEQAAQIAEQSKEVIEKAMDGILDGIDSRTDFYSTIIDQWREKLDKVHSSIEHNINALDHLKNILSLLGQSTNYAKLNTIYVNQEKMAKEYYNALKLEAEKAKKEYDQAIWDSQGLHGEDLEKYTKTRIQPAREALEAAEEAVTQAFEDWMNSIMERISNLVDKKMADAEDALTGKWGGFDALDGAVERARSLADEYLTKTNQIYETNKMMRTLSQDIDKTDSKIAKNKLKAFSDEIKALQEREKLSKTDLEIAQAKYEVLQAELALEEARNAKTTVRLQRDNEGNFGYVYTANQDDIANLEQTFEDKQNALYNLGLQKKQEYGERLISLTKEYFAELYAIYDEWNRGELTDEEEVRQRIIDLKTKYQELETSYLESHIAGNIVMNQIGAQGQTESWIDSFEEIITTQRLFTGDSKNLTEETTEYIIDRMLELKKEREKGEQEWKLGNTQVRRTVGELTTSVSNLSREITKKGGLADSMSQAVSQAGQLTRGFFSTEDAARALTNQFEAAIGKCDNLCDRADTLGGKLEGLIHRQIALNAAMKGADSVTWQTANIPSYSNKTSANFNNNNGGGGGGTPNIGNTGSDTPPKIIRYEPYNNQLHRAIWSNGSVDFENHSSGSNGLCSKCKLKLWQAVQGPTRSGKQLVRSVLTGQTLEVKASDLYRYGLKSGGYIGTWPSGKTGLYTGSWNGPDIEENGKLAFLHQKELVLNANDTENMLEAVKLIRQISQQIDLQAISQSSGFSAVATQFFSDREPLQQDITIHAEFPNATDHNEIEQAFENLANKASQFANRY